MINGHSFVYTHVVIIVYDRFYNLKHWLDCWDQCDQENASLIVVHNFDAPIDKYKDLVESHGCTYIHRPNVGFDIGAFQDLCRARLQGFPSWERVLWMTDDTFPMEKDFVKRFNQTMKKGVGVAAMEISKHVTTHIRTTGFMIDRVTAEKLKFAADPITTKQDCYVFEHRAKGHVFYNQIEKMGLTSEMVTRREISPLYDFGYHRRIKEREKEHYKKFGMINREDKVLFICPIYENYPAVATCLLEQTHKNWELIFIHDGPDTKNIKELVPDDPRIRFIESPKKGGFWGHYIRQVAIQEFKDLADYMVITNPDNYYTPVFCEYLLNGFIERPSSLVVYCAQMVHSYAAWKVLNCSLKKGFLDCGGVMIRSETAAAVGWRDITSHSADWTFFEDIMNAYGYGRFHKVPGCLFCHN